jgi:hypothetical protein
MDLVLNHTELPAPLSVDPGASFDPAVMHSTVRHSNYRLKCKKEGVLNLGSYAIA